MALVRRQRGSGHLRRWVYVRPDYDEAAARPGDGKVVPLRKTNF
jgi:hypothetical protein